MHRHITSYIHASRIGVMIEVETQTDFTTMTDAFKDLCTGLMCHIVAMNPSDMDELMAQNYVKREDSTVREIIDRLAYYHGEPVKLIRFTRFEAGK